VKEMKLDEKTIQELNPGLTDAVYSNRLLIPKGYRLRVPPLPGINAENQEAEFQLLYSKIPAKIQASRADCLKL
jgi:hypothetical protein